MKSLFAFIFGIGIVASSAQAHILEYDTIMSRAATNHGSGGYQIQQSLRWTADGAPMEILETWTVLSESKMLLSIQGVGRLKGRVHGEMVYDTQKKTLKNSGGTLVNHRLPPTFSPHFFHFRSSKWMRERLVSLKMAPPESLQNRPPLKGADKPNYTPQNFVTLQRVGGVITYGIGEKENPALFIEQDQFVVTKIQFSQGPAVLAENFTEYGGSFFYPQSVTYSLRSHTFKTSTNKVTYLGRNAKAEVAQFSKEPPPLTLPEEASIVEFYNTFR